MTTTWPSELAFDLPLLPRPRWRSAAATAPREREAREKIVPAEPDLRREPTVTDAADDSHLLARIAGGDRDAFRDFYDRYAAKVLAYVRMLSRDAAVSEDVVQEVFLAVFRKAGSYRPERGDVAGWLYTITRNKMVDLWRRRGPGEPTEEEFDFSRLPDERSELAADLRLSVRQVLAELSDDQRQAVELAYFGGLTYEETAARLRLPLGTLKSRIRAGLMSMRSRLAESRPREVRNA